MFAVKKIIAVFIINLEIRNGKVVFNTMSFLGFIEETL
jgi:hypothetical protein